MINRSGFSYRQVIKELTIYEFYHDYQYGSPRHCFEVNLFFVKSTRLLLLQSIAESSMEIEYVIKIYFALAIFTKRKKLRFLYFLVYFVMKNFCLVTYIEAKFVSIIERLMTLLCYFGNLLSIKKSLCKS